MSISKKFYIRTIIVAIAIGSCGLVFWQWSNHDDYIYNKAFRAAVCGGRVCETSEERDRYMTKYINDGNKHTRASIVLITTAILTALVGVIGLVSTADDKKTTKLKT